MPAPERSFVVTGGCGGVGAAIVARLRLEGHVVVLDMAEGADVVGDASDVDVASQAANAAERVAPLAGWVNNAAVFRDAWLHAEDVLPLITANLALAVHRRAGGGGGVLGPAAGGGGPATAPPPP